ncbi:MAG: hypothetical protein OXI43_12205 [Candidatus Poribacteria bacterium]|nr:hypothetical protein [Candidatus Poribacteria bacterium]
MSLMKPEENTHESLVQDFSLQVLGILTASAAGDPTGISAAVIPIIVREVFRQVINPLTTRGESKRLYQWGKQAAEGIAQRSNAGEEFRKDGFFEETPTNRSNFEEVVESTLKTVMAATEEPKVKFMANLTENVHFDEDLDMDTYRQILKDIDELTYRQLCIIRLATLYEKRKIIGHIDDEKWEEQIPQNERARFHSISRDFEEMMVDESYLDGVRGMKTEEGEPCMFRPSLAHRTYQAKRLYSFANLCEISIEDIVEMFSLWNVRPRKSE